MATDEDSGRNTRNNFLHFAAITASTSQVVAQFTWLSCDSCHPVSPAGPQRESIALHGTMQAIHSTPLKRLLTVSRWSRRKIFHGEAEVKREVGPGSISETWCSCDTDKCACKKNDNNDNCLLLPRGYVGDHNSNCDRIDGNKSPRTSRGGMEAATQINHMYVSA